MASGLMRPPLSAALSVSPYPRMANPRTWLALTGMVSLAAVIAGFTVLFRYQASPGPSGSALIRWPDGAPLTLPHDRPTLLLFAHPQCPCTCATVGELDRIAARCRDRVRIVVFFLSDPDRMENWTRSDLWKQARGIPGVEVRADIRGTIAQQFGVRTSGHVLLYAPDGRLLFEGGITDSRGHAGDNLGEDSVIKGILEGATNVVSTPVYGCSLRSELQNQTSEGTP